MAVFIRENLFCCSHSTEKHFFFSQMQEISKIAKREFSLLCARYFLWQLLEASGEVCLMCVNTSWRFVHSTGMTELVAEFFCSCPSVPVAPMLQRNNEAEIMA